MGVRGGGATEQNLFARTLPAQELAVAAVTAANAVSLLVLRGQRRRLAGAGPPGGRDWLRTVPRLNSFVFFGAAAFSSGSPGRRPASGAAPLTGCCSLPTP
jgi:hypothetical protein